MAPPPTNPARILTCPKCGTDRDTKAQPNTVLRCRNCGARFKAPPLGESSGLETSERATSPGMEATREDPPARGVEVVKGGTPKIPPADPPPPAATSTPEPPDPAPSPDPGSPPEGEIPPAPPSDNAPPPAPEPRKRGRWRHGGWGR